MGLSHSTTSTSAAAAKLSPTPTVSAVTPPPQMSCILPKGTKSWARNKETNDITKITTYSPYVSEFKYCFSYVLYDGVCV